MSDVPDPANGLSESVKKRREREERARREGERSLGRNLAMAGAIGWLVVIPILLAILIGHWLHQRMATGAHFTAALILVGAFIGGYLAWKRMQQA